VFTPTELDYVKKTLVIKRENNAFSPDFNVNHTTQPFLIIENDKSVTALGPRDLTSVFKVKTIPVTVIEMDQYYYGELQIRQYTDGFRKANLKYASKLLTLKDSKIASFMPVISVIPNNPTPAPYVSEAVSMPPPFTYWTDYVTANETKVYPDVMFQVPVMHWQDKFGSDMNADHEWFDYAGEINKRTNSLLHFNDGFSVELLSQVNNVSVVSPQVFLLAPLFYIAESMGYTLKGDFHTHEFVKKIVLFSDKDNMTAVKVNDTDVIDLTSEPFIAYTTFPDLPDNSSRISVFWNPTLGGNATLSYSFEVPPSSVPNTFVTLNITGFETVEILSQQIDTNNGDNYVIQGTYSFSVEDTDTGYIHFTHTSGVAPINPTVEIEIISDTSHQHTHTTVDLGRYVPDMTAPTYFTMLKNLFNLSIDVNDFIREIDVNFNENIAATEVPEILNHSLKEAPFDIAPNTSFLLKYTNDVDTAMFITRDYSNVFSTQYDQFNKELNIGFKTIPHNGTTSEISEKIVSREGVGLMIYDPAVYPNTVTTVVGQTLFLDGAGGVYESFWKKWLKFRLSASRITLQGPLTLIEFSKVNKAKAMYVDNQHYRIVSTTLMQSSNTLNEVKFELESVNF